MFADTILKKREERGLERGRAEMEEALRKRLPPEHHALIDEAVRSLNGRREGQPK